MTKNQCVMNAMRKRFGKRYKRVVECSRKAAIKDNAVTVSPRACTCIMHRDEKKNAIIDICDAGNTTFENTN